MRLDIKQANKRMGEKLPFNTVFQAQQLDLREHKLLSDVSVAGDYMYTGEDYLVRGKITADIELTCDRCGTEYTEHLDLDFEEEFATEADDAHWERDILKGDFIDLLELVEENIVLATFQKNLCNPECKGLCLICGSNLNTDKCDCNLE